MSENYREQMEARGWLWNEEWNSFRACGGEDSMGRPMLTMGVGAWGDGAWVAHYGMPGHGYDTLTRHPTPMAAADEAEAWLRKVLAPLRLPWLSVTPGGAR